MPGLILWKNQEIDRLRRDMDRLISRLWEDFGTPLPARELQGVPSVEVSETQDLLVIETEVPVLGPDDLEVSITDEVLTIKGNVAQGQAAQEGETVMSQGSYGFFSHSFRLPCKVLTDDVEATYRAGVLRIILPKCKRAAAREVRIRFQ
ncbi:MAG: Hsp20/alpha crystallin family protein [Deltaproteobacteria bacterium]|nr:Hsp20/alpha crystallin family protein [Deltaproteobacteria bacterium]